MSFWTPPSKFQTESNTNPYRSLTTEQMRQNYHRSLTEKMVSPDQLKMLRREVSEYLQFSKGDDKYQSNKKQLESFVSAVGTGNMKKAKEVFDRMDEELQDVIPQQIFKMLGESHLGPEYKYLGKDKKFGREFYEKGGQLFVTKGTGKFVQNLGSVEIKSNQKMIQGLVKESTELEEAIKVGDTVHLGHGTKGGTGVIGKVVKIEGGMVHIENEKGDTFKGPMSRVSVKESKLTPAQERDAQRRLKPTRATVAGVKLPATKQDIEKSVKAYQDTKGGNPGNTKKRRLRDLSLRDHVELGEAHYATMEFMSRMAKRDPQDFIDYIKMKKMGEAEVFQRRGINFLRVRVRMPDHMGELNKVAGGFGFYAGDVVKESAEINEWWEDQAHPRSRKWKNGVLTTNIQSYNSGGKTMNLKKGDDIWYHPYNMEGSNGRKYKLVIAATDYLRPNTYFAINPKHLGLKGYDNATGPANESVELDEEVSDMEYMMDAYWNYLVDYRASKHSSTFARHAADKPLWQKMVKFYYEGRKKEAQRIDSDYGFNQDVYEGIVDKKLPKTPMSYWVAVDGHDRYAKKNNLAESVEMNEEKFTSAQLNKLKQEYGKLKTVDPGSPTYTKLTKFLDGLSTEQLQQMVDARIPFLKGLALNRINRRKAK